MENYKTAPTGQVALVMMDDDGRICQLAMSMAQHLALQAFVSQISKDEKLVKMGSEYDLVPKSKVKKMMK